MIKFDRGNLSRALLVVILLFCSGAKPEREARASGQAATASATANATFLAGMELYRGGTLAAWQSAIARWDEALQQARQAEDRDAEALTLTWLGRASGDLKDFSAATEHYNQALQIYRTTGDRHSQASTLMALASIEATQGEYQRALESNEEALKLWRAVRYQTGEAAALNNIALIYADLGDRKTALDYQEKALKLIENAGNSLNIAATLNNIGRSDADLGNTADALAAYNRSLALWQAAKNPKGEASTLNNIGYLYASARDWTKARDYYQRALPLWQQLQDKGGEASTLTNLGDVEAGTGNRDRAKEFYNRALPLRQASRDRAKEALTRYRLAALHRDLGNVEEAKSQIEAAIAMVEDLRTNISRADLRASFFAAKQDYYELYIDLLMQQHRKDSRAGYDKLALQTSERARARTLLDILQEARADIRQGIDPELRDRERKLKQQLSAAEEQHVKLASALAPQPQIDAIARELETLVEQFRRLQAEIRSRSPRYAALTQPEPLSVEQIQQQVLDDRTLLLEYYLGAERSYAWLVTREGLTSYELPGRAQIEAAAKTYLALLKNPARRRSPAAEDARVALEQIILGPMRDRLSAQRLLIVADGVLQYLPFAALSANGQTPLIADFELLTLPSASTLASLRSQGRHHASGNRAIAVFADPVFAPEDERMPKSTPVSPPASLELQESARGSGILLSRLPYTKEEADRILALVTPETATPAIGFRASRNLATSNDLSQYRIIHFATHGLANSKNPELSGLVLSLFTNQGAPQNGFLRMHELYNLDLPADLVVLSACQTALGEQIRGEGIVGLTRGFMYAGVDRVVASLWNVDDRGTSELMSRFYQQMLEKGLTPAAALRAAQLEMSKTKEWESPFYWAGFTLQGEWD